MSNEIFRIRRLDDAAVHDIVMRAAEAARAAASADGLSGEEVKIIPEFFGISILGVLNLEETPPTAGRYTIKTARLSLQTTIAVDRNRPNETTTIRFVLSRGAENELDQLQVSREGSSGEDRWREGRGRAAVISAFDVLNGFIAPSDADPGSAIGQLSNFAENIDRSFRGFTQGVEGTLATLAEQRAEEQRLLEAERERMRTEITDERDRILERAKEEIDGERQRLKELEASLADREAQLDIKSHKDARRKLFADLQKDLQLAARKPTQGLMVAFARIAVFLVLAGAGAFAGYLALNTMTPETLGESATNIQIWAVILKPLGLTIAAFGAFAAAVQWLRHFYTRDLQVAEEFRRFQHDMARASWIIEATLEMEKEHQTSVPEKWLEHVTEGLFQSGRHVSSLDEGQQALAALLGLSTSVKAGPNGLEVDVGRKGVCYG
ncbi:MAG: hypothetical protein H9533_07280 [Rhodobacteraceae bacterium]|nr:hypothetical protein [Paracoccaceae bacterium]